MIDQVKTLHVGAIFYCGQRSESEHPTVLDSFLIRDILTCDFHKIAVRLADWIRREKVCKSPPNGTFYIAQKGGGKIT